MMHALHLQRHFVVDNCHIGVNVEDSLSEESSRTGCSNLGAQCYTVTVLTTARKSKRTMRVRVLLARPCMSGLAFSFEALSQAICNRMAADAAHVYINVSALTPSCFTFAMGALLEKYLWLAY